MKFCSSAVLVACAGVLSSSFSSDSRVSAWTATPSNNNNDNRMNRRSLLQTSLIGAATTILIPSQSTQVSLLDDYGGTDMKIETKQSVERAMAQPKAVSNMEPNLRSNYYYPTNKVRYLARIKKCNDAIPQAAEAIGTEQWDSAQEFVATVANDTILPMKLYTSSLLGGGTNVKVALAQDMKRATNDFEKAQKKLTKAVAKKDRELSSQTLEDLASALQLYRESGRLTGPDGGGDIPSVDEIRRSACRVQGRTFEQKIKDRDSRLKQDSTSTVTSASN